MKWSYRDSPSLLVIVGSWNVGIVLNPEWIKRFLYERMGDFELATLVDPLGFESHPRLRFDNITMMLQGRMLSFTVPEPSEVYLEKIQEVVIKLSDSLPHTPVVAFGINYNYTSKNESIHKRLLSNAGALAKSDPVSVHVKTQYKGDDYDTNLTLEASGEKDITLGLNFHHQLPSPDISEVKNRLLTMRLSEYKVEAERTRDQLVTEG